jgi:cytochrome bd ubiquinol oxidase subunit I
MISPDVVTLSRFQFALTAMYHFIFVPLTLGLSVLLFIMETVYVMTDKPIWRTMVKFWGILFGINFAMGVATGITMEFQFGTNWAYYSQYVGDIFGAPLAIEGMMAFFLEATFVGLFFFGWERLSKRAHLTVTGLLALGTNLSALWILVANGWMVHPVGSAFNFQSMRMEVTNFYDVLFNTVAQAKFVHTVSAGYVTGAMFVMAISAYYLLRGRNIQFAKRSLTVAACFGLAAALSVVVLGDESGYLANDTQQMKIAALEAMWDTEPAPAALTVFGFPDQKEHTTHYAIKIPYLLGLMATRSFRQPLLGIDELVARARPHVQRGIKAYTALEALQKDKNNPGARREFNKYKNDLGYGLLLKRYRDDIANATPEQITKATQDTVPKIAPLFWSFRFMVALGLYFIVLFGLGFVYATKRKFNHPWFLRAAFYSLPLPWFASWFGWFVAEYGRQPWLVEGRLPTFLGVSSVPLHDVVMSLVGFVVFYTFLAIIEMTLMVKYIRLGPDGLAKLNSSSSQASVTSQLS